MRVNRLAVVAVVAGTALLVGGGAALAGQDGQDRSARCEQRLEKIAERRGVSVAELEGQIKSKLVAGVDAALAAGRISPEHAAKVKERIAASTLCSKVRAGNVKLARHGMFKAAADFLELDRAALKAQLPGNSLGSLALKQGKSVEKLEAAMLAPATKRLAAAVAAGKITPARAEAALERLERIAERLIEWTFPAKA